MTGYRKLPTFRWQMNSGKALMYHPAHPMSMFRRRHHFCAKVIVWIALTAVSASASAGKYVLSSFTGGTRSSSVREHPIWEISRPRTLRWEGFVLVLLAPLLLRAEHRQGFLQREQAKPGEPSQQRSHGRRTMQTNPDQLMCLLRKTLRPAGGEEPDRAAMVCPAHQFRAISDMERLPLDVDLHC